MYLDRKVGIHLRGEILSASANAEQGLGLGGKDNIGECSINVVRLNKPKALTGLECSWHRVSLVPCHGQNGYRRTEQS